MRMRRKKNLDRRISAFEGLLLPIELTEKNSSLIGDGSELLCFDELFGNDHPVELEIGCGKGRFICSLAAAHPERNFIAVEKTRNVMVTACETAASMQLDNVRFIALPAEYLLRYIPSRSIGRIYLNFSCPYPQESSANRRLTHPKMLAIYRKLLVEGGSIIQKTDNMRLFEYSLETLSQCGFALHNVSLDLHRNPVPDNIMTEYEQRFVELGNPIYRLEAVMTASGDKE